MIITIIIIINKKSSCNIFSFPPALFLFHKNLMQLKVLVTHIRLYESFSKSEDWVLSHLSPGVNHPECARIHLLYWSSAHYSDLFLFTEGAFAYEASWLTSSERFLPSDSRRTCPQCLFFFLVFLSFKSDQSHLILRVHKIKFFTWSFQKWICHGPCRRRINISGGFRRDEVDGNIVIRGAWADTRP